MNNVPIYKFIANNQNYSGTPAEWEDGKHTFQPYHYLHGQLETLAGYDCVGFEPTPNAPGMPIVGGIFACKVDTGEGIHEAMMFRWLAVENSDNPNCKSNRYKAYIVLPDDTEAVQSAFTKMMEGAVRA